MGQTPASTAGPASAHRPRKASVFQLVFLTYAVICSGAYGLEEMVSTSGPGLAILILLALPVIYAAPIALTCSELASRFPVEGGYYRWVRLAFGDFVGYTSAWLVWITMFATTASFAVLFGNYLREMVPTLSAGGHFAAAASLVWLAVFLNYRGISLVGTVSVVSTLVIFLPFVIMTVLGFAQWRYSPVVPFANPGETPAAAVFGGVLIAMWLYGGFEKMTVNAEEVEDPRRAFPVALLVAVPLCALSYVLPTLAALAAHGNWSNWGESYFMTAAASIGGPWLGLAMGAGALVSNAALVTVTLLGQSRLPMVLADDGLFPRAFQQRHPRFGTPSVSLFVAGIVVTCLCGFRLGQLVAAAALVQSLSYLLIYATLFRLRRVAPPAERRGFRIPLGTAGLALMVAPSVVIITLVIRQGLFPDGRLDTGQALFNLAVFASGPITYALAGRRASRSAPSVLAR